MNKHSVTTLSLIIFIFNITYGMEKEKINNIHVSANPSSSRRVNTIDTAEAGTMEAIILSTSLPHLSQEYCDHIISMAPPSVQDQFSLLKNPATRTKILPDLMLLYGPPGTGKSTLARVIAQEMDMPFIIVKGAQLANEYANSAVSGIRRIGTLSREAKANVVIDEMDSISKSKKNNTNYEAEDEVPKAFWQMLDGMLENKILFIGNTNKIINMPEPLQERFELCIYEITLVPDENLREKVIRCCLAKRALTDSDETIKKLVKQTKGLSNRRIDKIISFAYKLALKKSPLDPVINYEDFKTALERQKSSKSELQKTEWSKKDVFNYTVQSIGAAANIVSMINSTLSLTNSYKSIAIGITGLKNQDKGIVLQESAIEIQKDSLVVQKESLIVQKDCLVEQKKGIILQEKSNTNQEKSLVTQETALRYQKWTGNPFSICAAAIGKTYDGAKVVGSSVGRAIKTCYFWITGNK